jgi:hypothetical protein
MPSPLIRRGLFCFPELPRITSWSPDPSSPLVSKFSTTINFLVVGNFEKALPGCLAGCLGGFPVDSEKKGKFF